MSNEDRYTEGRAHGRGPSAEQRPERVLGDVSTDVSKEARRIMYLEQLRARIDRGEYEVDPDAVASAVVERLEALADRLAHRHTVAADYASAEVVEPK
jgi:hypothetical protein